MAAYRPDEGVEEVEEVVLAEPGNEGSEVPACKLDPVLDSSALALGFDAIEPPWIIEVRRRVYSLKL